MFAGNLWPLGVRWTQWQELKQLIRDRRKLQRAQAEICLKLT